MLQLKKYPDPILKKQAQEIQELTPELVKLASHMQDAMEQYDGIGLAAPQIGVSKQIIVVKEGEGSSVFFNPVLQETSKAKETDEEGCLSLPGLFLPIKRAKKIQVVCHTKEGKAVVLEAEGLAARVFQHEIDHIQGKLIIERVSKLRRFRIKKQLKEIEAKGALHNPKHKTS